MRRKFKKGDRIRVIIDSNAPLRKDNRVGTVVDAISLPGGCVRLLVAHG